VLFRQENFPNLHPGNHRDTSEADRRYNCIAWAAGYNDKWWDPAEPQARDEDFYWPENVPRDYKVTTLVMVYQSVGFAICTDASQEEGAQKIAIYDDGEEYTHAARQLENGKWTSKMGPGEDIEHDTPESLVGPIYGQLTTFMKRKR